ncbi:MAG: isoprenyl transferase [Dethiobacteria bacterium]|jgi:undecaprenyl diphosphate synthase
MSSRSGETMSELTSLMQLIDWNNLPRHIAIIMDGNGRWATQKGLPRIAGHRAGMETLKKIISFSCEIKIPILTFYAFSTENWRRPPQEVNFLMRLPHEYIRSELQNLIDNNIRLKMSGDIEGLPQHTQKAVREALEKTEKNSGMILNFALNYGGRKEIINAVREIAAKVKQGEMSVDEINEDTFSQSLYTAGLHDPDLLIRPSGEMRLSNFLLWQLAYAELWFSDVYWPDFTEEHLLQAIYNYQKRDRRYGGIEL